MSIEFKFDKDAFERSMREHVEEIAQGIGASLQAALDAVEAQHGGQPVEQVRTALGAALLNSQVTLTDAELTEYAKAIADGTHINVKTVIEG